MGRKSLPQRRQIYDNGFTSSQVRTTLILLYHKLLKKCNTFNPIICKSKKKTNLFCFLTTFFKTARFEHENEMQRKALKHTQKTLESSPFGNPESSTRNPESTVWNPESKTLLDSLTWGESLLDHSFDWLDLIHGINVPHLFCIFSAPFRLLKNKEEIARGQLNSKRDNFFAITIVLLKNFFPVLAYRCYRSFCVAFISKAASSLPRKKTYPILSFMLWSNGGS